MHWGFAASDELSRSVVNNLRYGIVWCTEYPLIDCSSVPGLKTGPSGDDEKKRRTRKEEQSRS